jgi:hypothetical protein
MSIIDLNDNLAGMPSNAFDFIQVCQFNNDMLGA